MTGSSATFLQALADALDALRVNLHTDRLEKMVRHYEMMLDANRVMNLTRITDPREAAIKHYADSLALVACLHEKQFSCSTILDIGTGAGFPAVPVAIARPDLSVTAIDGTRKKIDFVCTVAAELELTNLEVQHAHSSHWDPQRSFDVVALRAVANPVEVAGRFIRTGGVVVHYSTTTDSAPANARVGNEWREESFKYCLPNAAPSDLPLDRALRLYRRTASTGSR